jgi:two-component system, chemotaxis family, response regulator Rcp1
MILGTGMKFAEILLIEDNPMDVLITQEALKDARVRNRLSVVENGEEAMDFLRHRGKYADEPLPDLILLDLNLPKKDGREVLEEVKADPVLKHIPIVILTSSEAKEDILKSYRLHCNCFITKPVDLEQFTSVVRSIEDFWFAIVTLPHNEKSHGPQGD